MLDFSIQNIMRSENTVETIKEVAGMMFVIHFHFHPFLKWNHFFNLHLFKLIFILFFIFLLNA